MRDGHDGPLIRVFYVELYGGKIGGQAKQYTTDGRTVGWRLFDVALTDYAEVFSTAVADRVVRRPGLPGVRVRILGPLEARLANIDRVVLGGLNEGTWPPETRSDAWLSRPMRHALGLDLPERRIALSAHDFAQMLGAREVICAYYAPSTWSSASIPMSIKSAARNASSIITTPNCSAKMRAAVAA